MARRQDYPTLKDTNADFGANIVEFVPNEDPLDIAVLRGSDIKSMIAYMGNETSVFRQIILMRPELFNLNNPFAFARFVGAEPLDGWCQTNANQSLQGVLSD